MQSYLLKKSSKKEYSKDELLMLMGVVFENSNTNYQI